MIRYVPDLNNIPLEENYAHISQEEIKDAFSQIWQMQETTQKEDTEGEMIAYLSSRILYKIFIEQYQILV